MPLLRADLRLLLLSWLSLRIAVRLLDVSDCLLLGCGGGNETAGGNDCIIGSGQGNIFTPEH